MPRHLMFVEESFCPLDHLLSLKKVSENTMTNSGVARIASFGGSKKG